MLLDGLQKQRNIKMPKNKEKGEEGEKKEVRKESEIYTGHATYTVHDKMKRKYI